MAKKSRDPRDVVATAAAGEALTPLSAPAAVNPAKRPTAVLRVGRCSP
ncbi:hypothetical protein [Kineococcus sp. SYSU DK003]